MSVATPELSENENTGVDGTPRMRWVGGRATFVVATLGAAITYENYFRYSIFMHTSGGAMFWAPYFVSMLVFGYPIFLLEQTVGQMFQRSAYGAFKTVHPRLTGVGLSTIFCAIVFASYYFALLGLGVLYFAESFRSPLKWSGEDFEFVCSPAPAQQYYLTDVLKVFQTTDTQFVCEFETPGDIDEVNWWLFFATAVGWFMVYLTVFKGTKSISYVAWVTLILPTVILFMMLFRNSKLDGAKDGIKLLIENEDDFKPKDEYETSEYYSDSLDFVYATLLSSTGIFMVFGSYNRRDKPIIRDSFLVLIYNCVFSFISAMMLFMMVGYLREENSTIADTLDNSLNLIFVIIPTAVIDMDGANTWCIVLYLMYIAVGVSTSAALIEAITCAISEISFMQKVPRWVTSGIICFFGIFSSIAYCTNIGIYLIDIVNHFTRFYASGLVLLFETVAFGWIFNYQEVFAKVDKRSALVYLIGFWLLITINPLVALFAYGSYLYIFLIILIVFYPLLLVVSFCLEKNMGFCEWYKTVAFANVDKVWDYIVTVSRQKNEPDRQRCWEPVFKFYFCLMVKYVCPFIFCYSIAKNLEEDLTTTYEGSYLREESYPLGTTMIGWVIPMINLFIIFIPALVVTSQEKLGFNIFKPFDNQQEEARQAPRRVLPVNDNSQIQMSNISPSNISGITNNVAMSSERVPTEQRLQRKF